MGEKQAVPATLQEALHWAKGRLGDRIERPARAAELLLCEAAGIRREHIYAHPEAALAPEGWSRFRAWVERHRKGEPIQYIVGRETFFGLPFVVNRHVLIPRPETELLVEAVLMETAKKTAAGGGAGHGTGGGIGSGGGAFGGPGSGRPLRVADIGTGSGVIAVTLARFNPHWEVWAVDCSAPALDVARENARRLGAPGIRWLLGDFCLPLAEHGVRVDVLVSNPPYVARPELERLAPGVRDFEPRLALDGGEDGLDAYRCIVEQLPAVLAPGALVAFEVGMGQAEAVAVMLRTAGCVDAWAQDDLAGIPRFVFARFP